MMKRLEFRKILLFALLPLLLNSCGDPKRKAMDLKMEGIDLLYKNKFDDAIGKLNESLEFESKDPETYFYIGTAYFGKKDVNKAFEYYTKAIEVDSTYGKAYINRGRIYKERKEHDKACGDWLKAESLGEKSIKEETKFCK